MLICRQKSESGTRRLRLAVAFIMGMALTAALAQTPLANGIFSPGAGPQQLVPALPNTPDPIKAEGIPNITDPAQRYMNELVCSTAEEAAPNC
jgi:hypothetical protein